MANFQRTRQGDRWTQKCLATGVLSGATSGYGDHWVRYSFGVSSTDADGVTVSHHLELSGPELVDVVRGVLRMRDMCDASRRVADKLAALFAAQPEQLRID